MSRPWPRLAAALTAVLVLPAALAAGPPAAAPADRPQEVRFATFNASLNRSAEGSLVSDLSTPGDQQAANVAEIIQRTRPDVLLVNEFDFDAAGTALQLFQENYLSVPHNGAEPIEYPYRFAAPSNTGVPSGFDLNNDGRVGGPDDAYGFGFFPGQFGMAVYSRHPIDLATLRTFQMFLWRDMPGALLPDDPATPAPADWYSAEELDLFRLSSKSHWDVPIRVRGRTVHFLVSHPTPPVFDGPEDRNGRRNHDEIRFWADYVHPARGRYVYDDDGRRGGLPPGSLFVVAGDQNADPFDGDSVPGAAQQLLEHPLVDPGNPPSSEGGAEASGLQGGANLTHRGDPALDTADFNDQAPGNLRVDYVLPHRAIKVRQSAVFWPTTDGPLFRLTGTFDPALPGGFPSSDHRLVWIDVAVAAGPSR
jgi:hypothetical protein